MLLLAEDQTALPEKFRRDGEGPNEWRDDAHWPKEGLVPFNKRAKSTNVVKSLVCVRSIWTPVGVYQRSNRMAAQMTWHVRVVSWPDGAMQTGTSFPTTDPPAEARTDDRDTCQDGDRRCQAIHGEYPDHALTKWLDQMIAS